MTHPLVYLAVALAGGAAAVARMRITALVARHAGTLLPWGTLTVNACACIGAGAVIGAGPPPAAEALLAVGALGSLGTFSTWVLEISRMWAAGRRAASAAYAALSLVAGAAAVGVGLAAVTVA